MGHVDAHGNLVLHHLHEFAEGGIFVGLDQSVLSLRGLTTALRLPILYHVDDKTDFEQVGILGHRAELLAELLLGCVVEVGPEVVSLVSLRVAPAVARLFAGLPTLLLELLSVENEKVDLAHKHEVRKRVFHGDRVLCVVARLQNLLTRQIEHSE